MFFRALNIFLHVCILMKTRREKPPYPQICFEYHISDNMIIFYGSHSKHFAKRILNKAKVLLYLAGFKYGMSYCPTF